MGAIAVASISAPTFAAAVPGGIGALGLPLAGSLPFTLATQSSVVLAGVAAGALVVGLEVGVQIFPPKTSLVRPELKAMSVIFIECKDITHTLLTN